MEILEKISSYNIFNYLLPGILFALGAEQLFAYPLVQDDPIVDLFLYYFLGMTISRLGSVIVEPFLKWTGFVKFANYGDFVAASKVDSKIDILSEQNNVYRTLCALFLSLICLGIYKQTELHLPGITPFSGHILIAMLLVLFLYSHRKQTSYVRSRVRKNVEGQS